MTGSYERLQNGIDNTLELTTVCRGEWCRELETEVDLLEDEVWSICRSEGSCACQEVRGLEEKIHKSIVNLSPNIHI